MAKISVVRTAATRTSRNENCRNPTWNTVSAGRVHQVAGHRRGDVDPLRHAIANDERRMVNLRVELCDGLFGAIFVHEPQTNRQRHDRTDDDCIARIPRQARDRSGSQQQYEHRIAELANRDSIGDSGASRRSQPCGRVPIERMFPLAAVRREPATLCRPRAPTRQRPLTRLVGGEADCAKTA